MSGAAFLSVAQSWSLGSQMADKKSVYKLYILFQCFVAVYDKQANIRCSIGSISRPIFSRNYNATDQAIAMAIANATSQNLIISFLENNSTDWLKNLFSSYFWFLHGVKNFQSSSITFNIFNNSIFFGTRENK